MEIYQMMKRNFLNSGQAFGKNPEQQRRLHHYRLATTKPHLSQNP